jgi:hypothetical protein
MKTSLLVKIWHTLNKSQLVCMSGPVYRHKADIATDCMKLKKKLAFY